MNKSYWYILLTYIAMHLSALVGAPLSVYIVSFRGLAPDETIMVGQAYWSLTSFIIALAATLFFLKKDMADQMRGGGQNQAGIPFSVLCAILGVFLALYSQSIAIRIETAMGISPGSENTAYIVKVIETIPFFILISSIIGPILEEIVFRKVIFGAMRKKMNVWLAALGSSLIFGAAHLELEHLLLYTFMGLVFTGLYAVTNRILVPIFAHVAMNTLVVLSQIVFVEDFQKLQSFIGGLL